jgi:hypothetical protein
MVEHVVHALARTADLLRVGDVPLQELHRLCYRRQVLPRPRGEIVQHPYLRALVDQGLHDMRADEPRASRYQTPPRPLLTSLRHTPLPFCVA